MTNRTNNMLCSAVKSAQTSRLEKPNSHSIKAWHNTEEPPGQDKAQNNNTFALKVHAVHLT